MRYTKAQLLADLNDIRAASTSPDPMLAAAAAVRGRSLLRASGTVGNLVEAYRRDLEHAVAACNNALAAMSTAPPEEPQEPQQAPVEPLTPERFDAMFPGHAADDSAAQGQDEPLPDPQQ